VVGFRKLQVVSFQLQGKRKNNCNKKLVLLETYNLKLETVLPVVGFRKLQVVSF
jgi:hypothetical protein